MDELTVCRVIPSGRRCLTIRQVLCYNSIMVEAFSERLRRAIRESGESRYAISVRTGIDQASLCKFIQGQRGLGMDSIDRLMDAESRDHAPQAREEVTWAPCPEVRDSRVPADAEIITRKGERLARRRGRAKAADGTADRERGTRPDRIGDVHSQVS